MNRLGGALSAEWIKLKFTGIFWLSTAGTVFTNVMIAVLAVYLPTITTIVSADVTRDTMQWVHFHYDGILPMLLPMYIVILCALSVRLENQGNSWKMLYTLPVQKPLIYVSKLIMVLFAFVFSHGIFWVLMNSIPGIAGFSIENPLALFGGQWPLFALTIVSSLGILGLMFWVSYFFKGFVFPLAVGILGFVIAQLLADNGVETTLFPFSHPAIAVESWLDEERFRTDVLSMSLLWFAVFAGLGAIQTRRDIR